MLKLPTRGAVKTSRLMMNREWTLRRISTSAVVSRSARLGSLTSGAGHVAYPRFLAASQSVIAPGARLDGEASTATIRWPVCASARRAWIPAESSPTSATFSRRIARPPPPAGARSRSATGIALKVFLQLASIDLAVRVLRQLVERPPPRREHVRRQCLGELRAKRLGGDVSAGDRDIGATDRRALEPVGGDRDDGTLLQRGNRVQRGLDLPELDPIAAALDLGIRAAEEVDKFVRAERRQVTGPVDSVGRIDRSEEHTSELQSPDHLVCRLLLEKKKNIKKHQ